MPFHCGSSSRDPVLIQMPIEAERMCCICSVITVRPLGSTSRWMLRTSSTIVSSNRPRRLRLEVSPTIVTHPADVRECTVYQCRIIGLHRTWRRRGDLGGHRPPACALQSMESYPSIPNSMSEEKQNVLLGLTLQELTDVMEEGGQPGYRGRQVFEAVYSQRVEYVEEI